METQTTQLISKNIERVYKGFAWTEIEPGNNRFMIKKVEVWEEDAKIVKKYGQGCNYPTGWAVDCYQVDFDILDVVENVKWHFTFQSDDRTDNLRAYCGYEMGTAIQDGCDIDESSDFRDYYEDSDYFTEAENFLAECNDIAEEICKKYFESHAPEIDPLLVKDEDEQLSDFDD